MRAGRLKMKVLPQEALRQFKVCPTWIIRSRDLQLTMSTSPDLLVFPEEFQRRTVVPRIVPAPSNDQQPS